jgi:hypothetical protein
MLAKSPTKTFLSKQTKSPISRPRNYSNSSLQQGATMTAINGHANASAASHPHGPNESASATAMLGVPTGVPLTPPKIKELVRELEVPFDACVIEWRVTNTTKATAIHAVR